MAAVPITLIGAATYEDGTTRQVTFSGVAALSGLGVGGGPPLGTWGGGSLPHPDQGLPGQQPRPDQGLPGNQPYPGQGLPGNQPYPGQGLPGFPGRPDQGLPGNQ